MFAILIGPAGMFEHEPEPPPAAAPPAAAPPDDGLLDELHAASPKAITAPTATGRNLRRKSVMDDTLIYPLPSLPFHGVRPPTLAVLMRFVDDYRTYGS
jgi:hypothetical protein